MSSTMFRMKFTLVFKTTSLVKASPSSLTSVTTRLERVIKQKIRWKSAPSILLVDESTKMWTHFGKILFRYIAYFNKYVDLVISHWMLLRSLLGRDLKLSDICWEDEGKEVTTAKDYKCGVYSRLDCEGQLSTGYVAFDEVRKYLN